VRRCARGAAGRGGRDERNCKECLEPIYASDAVLYVRDDWSDTKEVYCEECDLGLDEGRALTA
jgi:hypothetical protein